MTEIKHIEKCFYFYCTLTRKRNNTCQPPPPTPLDPRTGKSIFTGLYSQYYDWTCLWFLPSLPSFLPASLSLQSELTTSTCASSAASFSVWSLASCHAPVVLSLPDVLHLSPASWGSIKVPSPPCWSVWSLLLLLLLYSHSLFSVCLFINVVCCGSVCGFWVFVYCQVLLLLAWHLNIYNEASFSVTFYCVWVSTCGLQQHSSSLCPHVINCRQLNKIRTNELQQEKNKRWDENTLCSVLIFLIVVQDPNVCVFFKSCKKNNVFFYSSCVFWKFSALFLDRHLSCVCETTVLTI